MHINRFKPIIPSISTGLPKEHITATKERQSKLSKGVKVGSIDGALTIYYDALMTYIIKNLNRKVGEITPPKVAFPVVIAGGSAMPDGFFEMFEKKLKESKLRIEISKMKRARDPLHAVARGCLIAAKTHEEGKMKNKPATPAKKKHKETITNKSTTKNNKKERPQSFF